MQKLLSEIRKKPLELLVGLCIFMVAASGAAMRDVASASLAVLFITSLFYINEWKASWQLLEKAEKFLFIGFMLYTMSALLSWINAEDSAEFVKQFGRYIRFTLIVPVYLMIRAKNLDVSRYFIVGVVFSGFVYLAFALHSVYERPGMPASGYYHHITFGDAIMLNAGIMGVLLLMPRSRRFHSVVIGISLLCALYAGLLSQARGAWIVLPVYLFGFAAYSVVTRKVSIVKLTLAAAVVVMLVILTPAGKMIEKRYDEAVNEVSQFMQGERFDTSIGGRLAMWDIAYDVWMEHPVIGTGLGDFDEDMVRYQAMGKYPDIEVHGSTHNIFVQALVSTGVVGFIVLCYALVIAPLFVFRRGWEVRKPFALMGILLSVSYAIFGLSESWILRAPAISVFIAYVVALSAILMRKEVDTES